MFPLYQADVCFVLFRFRIFAFIVAAALRPIFLRYAHAPTTPRSYLTRVVCVLLFFYFFSFCLFGDVAFSEYFVSLPFPLCIESRSYVSPFRMAFFYLVTTGRSFYISLLCENSINHSIVDPRLGGPMRVAENE